MQSVRLEENSEQSYLELLLPLLLAPRLLAERLLLVLGFRVGFRDDVASTALISDANCNRVANVGVGQKGNRLCAGQMPQRRHGPR